MFEVSRTYPTALAADPHAPDLAIRTAIRWVLGQRNVVGGQILVYVPAKQNVEHNELVRAFCAQPGIALATWRTGHAGWPGGPVLAAWPSRDKLSEVADWAGVRALCVVPWSAGETDAWVIANNPALLGGAVMPTWPAVVDPVVAEGLRSLTQMVNHSNNLAGPMDKRDAVCILRTLHDGGYRLEPTSIYAWALAHGWPGRGAERLREMATKIGSGVRMRAGGPSPLRPEALQRWKEAALQADR